MSAEPDAETGPPEKVTHLVVQTRWPPLHRDDGDGGFVQRVVASEKDTDTLAREILASGVIRRVPDASGPLPDLTPYTALKALVVEDRITTPLPETLGQTHHELRVLHLQEWETEHARVPASFRGSKALLSLKLPGHGRLDCGLALPALVELVLPIGVLHRWRAEISDLASLEALTVLPDTSGVRELPEEVATLSKLVVLRADHLGLRSLPPLPASLEQLSVEDNQLTSLAPRFGALELLLLAGSNPLAKSEMDWIAKEMKKPAAERSPVPTAEAAIAAASHHPRFFHPTWEGVGTIALAGEVVVIGRRGGYGAAAFDRATGQLLWEVPLGFDDAPRAVTSVGLHERQVLAYGQGRLVFIEPRTGAILRDASISAPISHAFFAGAHLFGLGPDPVWWGKGGGQAYRLPDLEPVAGFENIGAVSTSGRLVTTLGDPQKAKEITIVEVATGRTLGTIAESNRHTFRGDQSLFVIDKENVAHEHALDGARLRSFPLGADMEALPVNRRARPAVPYCDPTGDYLVIPRISARRSVVDNTVAIHDAASGALLTKTAAHTPLRGNLDPRYYGDEYSPIEHPAVLRHGETLFVGALVRAKDEPVVGTGLTEASLPTLSRPQEENR